MKEVCESQDVKTSRSVELPVLKSQPTETNRPKTSKAGAWRAISLTAVTLLMVIHYIQWRFSGRTISPIEPSETMYTLQNGAINAGFIFFTLAIVATLIFPSSAARTAASIAVFRFVVRSREKCAMTFATSSVVAA
jgi:hypothetical protein